ncbi:MAG: ABC transporter permease [Gemmataceae bacterium]
MDYALLMVWSERRRFLPAILAVTFSTLLIALQFGLLIGVFAIVSIPIDQSQADVWVGYPGVKSIDLGLPIPEDWRHQVARYPEVERTEAYVQGYIPWGQPGRSVEMCLVVGTRLDADSLGAIGSLTPEMRYRLMEPGTIVVAEGDKDQLGIRDVGHVAELAGHRVRVVGFLPGIKGLGGAYLFCSLQTARMLLEPLGLGPDRTIFILARCRSPEAATSLVQKLRDNPNISAYTREEFSLSTRWYWLTRTKAGLNLGYASLLGLIVGAAITSQTLAGAVAASAREFAVLEALGIPTGRMATLILQQALLVGLFGVVLAFPLTLGLAQGLTYLGTTMLLPPSLVLGASAVTLTMALLSGLWALRSLRLAEPAVLLR